MDSQAAHEFLRSRHSVRRYIKKPVPADILTRILETAIQAPNAHNRQSWRFVHLASPESRATLAEAMGAEFLGNLLREGVSIEEAEAQVARSRARILDAPEAILLCLDRADLDTYEDPDRTAGEELMGVQSVALAGGQLLLAAHAEGLGGVWVCAPLFAQAAVRRALDLPESWLAQGLILLGYPAEEPAARSRKPLSEVLLER
jgi:coenzyme F420-0:L-glutamate ligase/coenzyme F420-1:gamma-L-glutamate ligase